MKVRARMRVMMTMTLLHEGNNIVVIVIVIVLLDVYQVLAVEQVSVDAKEGGNSCCIYLAVEQVYYT